MNNDDLVILIIKRILEQKFGIQFNDNSIDTKKPIYSFFGSPNAINCLYFLLEVSIRFHIPLSSNMIERGMKWNLSELANEVIRLQGIS